MQSVNLVAPTTTISSKRATPAKLSAVVARPVATRTSVVVAQASVGRREAALAGFAALAVSVLPVGQVRAYVSGWGRTLSVTHSVRPIRMTSPDGGAH